MFDLQSSKPTGINVSSNVLFHFTNKMHNLLNILEHEFSPRYCPEFDLDRAQNDPTLGPRFAKPMVSFCDLPLSLIKEHLSRYGNYGIGLKKQWGIERRITPVLYVHDSSSILEMFRTLLISPEMLTVNPQFTYDQLFYLLGHVKPYEGEEWRSNRMPQYQDNVRFYNEREWRFVPRLSLTDEKARLDSKQYQDEDFRNRATTSLEEEFRLGFTPDDIHYIIVSREDEILEMVKRVNVIKRYFDSDTKTKLTTKILSAERIWEDF